MTPADFQSQSDAWIQAAAHVVISAGSAVSAVAAVGYAAWLKWGPQIQAFLALVQQSKARLDVHDQRAGIDSAKLAAPAISGRPGDTKPTA